MAPTAQPSHLGVSASCTIKLCSLHPKNNIEGPEESFFNQQQDGDAAAPPAAGGATAEEQ